MKMTARTRAVDKVFKRRDRYEIPSWQRGKVWGKPKQQLLIDTMLRGWKLPKFTFIKSDNSATEYEVADGQQRLNAIFEFMSGNLELSSESQQMFGVKKYADLPSDISDAFDDFEIEFDEIEDETDKEIKKYFQRLQEGMALNGSEKLNSIDSKLRDFCMDLTKHKFFTKTVAFKDTRYAFFEVIAKATSVEVEGFSVGLRVDDLKRVFEAQASFSADSKVAKRVRQALDYLNKALPSGALITRNRSTTQSLINLACKIVEHSDAPGRHTEFGSFSADFSNNLSEQIELGQDATDHDYIAYQRTVNANVKTGALTRHRILLRKLMIFDPAFAEEFSAADIATSNIDAGIKEAGKDLRELIVALNEQYSQKTGGDLFKITNKVVKTLNVAADPVKGAESFSAFLSGMYFVFKESIGKKLTVLPDSFSDINTMRIALQHDIDQEGPTAAAKKKKDQGKAFEKYLGVKSPSLASDDRLLIGQLKIMLALRSDIFDLIDT